MKQWILLILLLPVFIHSCTEKSGKTDESEKKEKQVDETLLSLDERAKRHVEAVLKIPGTEKYSLRIYKEHLDGDNREDAIITVNRYAFAIDEAAKSGNAAKKAEIGYMGSYNYIFFFDGGLNKISPEIVIPSTPQKELGVKFENISSEAFKDIVVDFRIRNAAYKDFFTVINHSPTRVFQWKSYDGLGETESEAFHFKFAEGSIGLQKDILVLKAEIVQPKEKVDLNTYEPKLIESNEIVYRFFYNPQMGKYATKNK